MPLNSRLDICLVMSLTGVVSLLLPNERLCSRPPRQQNGGRTKRGTSLRCYKMWKMV